MPPKKLRESSGEIRPQTLAEIVKCVTNAFFTETETNNGLTDGGSGDQRGHSSASAGQEAEACREVSPERPRKKPSAHRFDPFNDDTEAEYSDTNSEDWLCSEWSGCSSPSQGDGGRTGGARGHTSSREHEHVGGSSGGGAGPECVWYHSDWKPKTIPFTATPGPINGAASLDSDKPVDFVELFLTDELLQGIVEQTNRFAEQHTLNAWCAGSPQSRIHTWKPLTLPELKTFFGLFFLTGVIRKPNLTMYWSTDELIATPYFNRSMSRNRFEIIWRFLHFSDSTSCDTNDRLYKVRPVLDYVVSKFRELYQPGPNICIDEGMLLWRGRLAFKVYNPQKPVKYGIKSYILCDSDTGYCFNMKPYAGEPVALGDTVVFLLDRLVGHGYRLFMDNCYNSVEMCDQLLDLDTYVCGTLGKNRGEPPAIQNVSNAGLGIGETIMCHNKRVMVLAWRGKKIVKMVTSLHQNEMENIEVAQRGQKEKVPQQKPVCIVDYNRSMNAVNKLDQNLVCHPFIRKSAKWSKKFVTYLFQMCFFNAFIIYRAKNHQGGCSNFLSFISSVVRSWTSLTNAEVERVGEEVGGNAATAARGRGRGAGGRRGRERRRVGEGEAGLGVGREGAAPRAPYMSDPQSRLDAKLSGHQLVHIPPTLRKERPGRRCRVCIRKGYRSETRYFCKACNVPLHVGECFNSYHSKASYTQ